MESFGKMTMTPLQIIGGKFASLAATKTQKLSLPRFVQFIRRHSFIFISNSDCGTDWSATAADAADNDNDDPKIVTRAKPKMAGNVLTAFRRVGDRSRESLLRARFRNGGRAGSISNHLKWTCWWWSWWWWLGVGWRLSSICCGKQNLCRC